jgi:uncharacterized repeat protein (TIGR03803 family)
MYNLPNPEAKMEIPAQSIRENTASYWQSGNCGPILGEQSDMKRVLNLLGKQKWCKRACFAIALGAATAFASPAQTLTTLVNFDGANGGGLGEAINMVVLQGMDGDFYGTRYDGGANVNCDANSGCGTVFKITPSGTLTTLYNFCSRANCTDGSAPAAGLVQATGGDFYGTTAQGGDKNYGTVFTMTPGGKLTTLYSFCTQTNCTDGTGPFGLMQASNGDLYGITNQGGANNAGTVFRITTRGKLTTLYNFCSQTNCTDGGNPYGTLIQATDGNLYGTTYAGGADSGGGTVFKITPAGALTTLCTVGGYPTGTLVQATDGNFYGTTAQAGTVFKMTPNGTLTTLATVGGPPYAGLVQGSDAKLYGTTYVGGANNNSVCQGYGCGTIFEISLSHGTLTTPYNFCEQLDCTDGAFPLAGLAQATNGKFYGTTVAGGADGDGTIFSLGMGLHPFVETRPTAGAVGATVVILGNQLTSATSVSFHGTAASFVVHSGALVTATVPIGATSGIVEVVTPSGTLLSNVPFRVLQ